MKNILIISGDPNSINSELIFKLWKKININTKKKIYIISNYNLLKKQFRKLKYKIKISKVTDINKTSNADLKILDVDLKFKNPFSVPNKSASKFLTRSLEMAHSFALKKNIVGIINCPINKSLLNFNNYGITEYLAKKCKVKNNSEVMLIYNKYLAVAPVTTHLDLKNVSKNLNKNLIINKIKTLNTWYKTYKKKKIKIGILGLNPHNAELKKDSEERKIIIPSISALKKKNINITGPLVADTIFINNFKKFDVIDGMYHDQVLTPFKSLFKFNAINITLGLKYLRLSPDHGVAYDLIGKNKANADSLINCVNFLKNI